MKKNFKLRGFTLIEVLIALFILALSSLVLVTAYVSAYGHVKSNTQLTDRMSEQQKYVESKTSTNASGDNLFDVVCDKNVKNSLSLGSTNNDVFVKMTCTKGPSTINSKNFRINCAVYTIKNLENGNGTIAADDDELNVDFKYFEGSNAKS